MNSNFDGIRAEVNGVEVVVIAVTASAIAERVRNGLLGIDAQPFGNEALGGAGFARQDDHHSRVRLAEEDLRGNHGIRHPLVWHAMGRAESIAHVDLDAVMMTTNLGTAAEHEAILNVLRDHEHAEQLAGARFPVIVYPPLERSVASRVRAALLAGSNQKADFAIDLVNEFLKRADPKFVDRIEIEQNHVATRSPKITSKKQLETAIRVGWARGEGLAQELDHAAEYLGQFMAALGEFRPEMRPDQSRARSQLRPVSLSTGALAMNAYIAVASHLFHEDGQWTDRHQAVLAASPLHRRNRIGDTVEAARKRSTDLRLLTPPRSASGDALAGQLSRTIDLLVGAHLESVGYSPSRDHRYDYVIPGREEEAGIDVKLFAPGASEPQMSEHAFRSTLEAASLLVRQLTQHDRGSVDFFDIDAPWWILGQCVGYRLRGGQGDLQRRQAKNHVAKRWAGELAIKALTAV